MKRARIFAGLIVASGLGAAITGAPAVAVVTVPPAALVKADGNDILNRAGERFDPATVNVPPGAVVQWINVDSLAPHTVTEDHGLFDLTGDYGATPVNPAGFGPQDTRSYQFPAGSFHYFCRVHP